MELWKPISLAVLFGALIAAAAVYSSHDAQEARAIQQQHLDGMVKEYNELLAEMSEGKISEAEKTWIPSLRGGIEHNILFGSTYHYGEVAGHDSDGSELRAILPGPGRT